MNLSPILSQDTCAKCKNCCVFKRESLVYVPHGVEVVLCTKGAGGEQFVCIYRDEKMGCKLGSKKPMECEAWPFSVSRLAVSEYGNLELLLVLEHSCPPLNKSECLDDIKKFALENVADKLFEYSLKNLETLREYDKRNIVIESRSFPKTQP